MIDFGIAKVMDVEFTQSFVGTPEYLAPEIIKSHDGLASGYNEKCDMWACGVVLYGL